MDSSYFYLYILGLVILVIIIAIMSYYLYIFSRESGKMEAKFSRLNESFNELDEQAKLIVKTDLELNKAQEELDKRLSGLDALQKISRQLSKTFDENEVFQRLDLSLLGDLGFEKYLVFTLDENKKPVLRYAAGYLPQEYNTIAQELSNHKELMQELQNGNMISSLESSAEKIEMIFNVFHVRNFVITPILSQDNMTGIIFAGNSSEAFGVTEGDNELISILSDQIGQTVENARLFEQVYHSRQILEANVQERTKQLSSALEEVQAISRNKSEFISAVSHELRTPLTSIKGYASILITGSIGEIPDKVKERLEKINKHSDNLVKLINDLLDISRIESGKTEMKISPHAILPIIENVVDLLTPQMKEKNIILQKEIPPDCPQIPMDLSQVERVFINLISNAIKFTPRNGLIQITVTHDNQFITFAVKDNGIGISAENISQLFNEFYRIDNEINQNVKGTGLGLALCKKIVTVHGGRIWVTSEPQKGATFTFTLPVKIEKNLI